ncbi:hypothetical protein [Streptomyces sp. 6-11-2]|uniref:hypothetical protein n=1 Tax=Streptomyces sp. 6-11-2 TaxID=2585753 RepID=UPI00155AAE14|nr:hypothetical protein [Streptomyces sp. 6-11-2]
MALPKFVSWSWWSRPKVRPISWQATKPLRDGGLYVAVLKYVSLSFAVPEAKWIPPLTDVEATPSQTAARSAGDGCTTMTVACSHASRQSHRPDLGDGSQLALQRGELGIMVDAAEP